MRELGIGEVVSKTFELFRRNFVKYVILILIVEEVIGLADVWAYNAFPVSALSGTPTLRDVLNRLLNVVYLVSVVGVVSLVFGTIAYGSTIKMASEEIECRPVDLGTAVRFAASKMLWIWVLGIILGIIIGVGFIALVVPGIILAIMFSLSFQALLIEIAGITGSVSRSRARVVRRWLKN